MKKELQDRLYTSYPKIFRQKDLSMMETCMFWGIDTLDGWYNILDQLCGAIQDYIDNNKKPQVEASQVKEKWGGLSFYYSGGDDVVQGAVMLAEHLSYKTCEICGSIKDVECKENERHWVSTRCKTCRDGTK